VYVCIDNFATNNDYAAKPPAPADGGGGGGGGVGGDSGRLAATAFCEGFLAREEARCG